MPSGRPKGSLDKQPRKSRDIVPFTAVQPMMDGKPAEVKAIMGKLLDRMKRQGVPKFDTPDEMRIMIEDYFLECMTVGLFPTKRGLSMALGTTYAVLRQWEAGERGPAYTSVIKKASEFLADMDEQLVLQGIENPVLFMFRSKNYHGLRDQTDLVVTPNNPLGDQVDPKDIMARLEAGSDD